MLINEDVENIGFAPEQGIGTNLPNSFFRFRQGDLFWPDFHFLGSLFSPLKMQKTSKISSFFGYFACFF